MANFSCKITSQAMMSTMAVIMQINNNSSVIKSKLKLMTMDHKDYFKNKTKRLCYSSLLRLLISSSAMYIRVLQRILLPMTIMTLISIIKMKRSQLQTFKISIESNQLPLKLIEQIANKSEANSKLKERRLLRRSKKLEG